MPDDWWLESRFEPTLYNPVNPLQGPRKRLTAGNATC